MKQILTPTQIQQATFRINCGDQEGTAFYVKNNMLLTAFHVVANKVDVGAPIDIVAGDRRIPCNIHDYDVDLDICLLVCEEISERFLPLQASPTKIKEDCQLFGYPYQSNASSLSLSGKIAQVIIGEISDFVVGEFNIAKQYDYSGLSGAPLVTSGYVSGVVLRQSDDRIACISVKKLQGFLEKNVIPVKEADVFSKVPQEFNQDVETSTPNYTVISAINDTLGKEGSYILIYGAPGSGKSTLMATFKPSNIQFVLCGHYFIKVPNSTLPVSTKISPQFFWETMEQLLSTTLTGELLPKEEMTWDNRVIRLTKMLAELGQYYEQRGKTGIIIIDGLDDVTNIENFLAIFPSTLHANVKIILSCTSEAILPVAIRSVIRQEQKVEVTPLDLVQCEAFIMQQVVEPKLTVSTVQQIAYKSEGHPLYLRYLVNYVLTQKLNEQAEKLNDWIESIPVISGDITKYYDTIWEKISQQPDRLWPVLILAQLRQTVLPRDLFKMLPEAYKLSFQTFFPSIRYLFGQGEQIEIYHSSFKEYVDQKAEINIAQANDYILTYCDKHPEELYAVTNRLYHITKSNSAELAISNCDQNWADKCALADVSPDLVLSDIQRIIDMSVDGLQTTALIRLLLLLERIKFRYDSVFAENASRIALALISLKKFVPSLNYIIRDKTILVSDNDALHFLQLYYENGATSEGDKLFESIDAKFRRVLQEETESGKGVPLSIFKFKLDALSIMAATEAKWPMFEFMKLQRLMLRMKSSFEEHGMIDEGNAIQQIREVSSANLYAFQLRQFDHYASAETVSKFSNDTVDAAWTTFYGRALFQFNQFNFYNVPGKEKSKRYFNMLKEVEDMMETNGYEESFANAALLVESLMCDSKRSNLIIRLIGDYLKNPLPSYTLKVSNGVDANIIGMEEMMFRYKCLGYIDEKNEFPSIDKRSARHEHWENYLLSLLQRISFLEGKLYRLKADNIDYSETARMFSDLTTAINFSLDERRYWKSSYGVPEAVLPMIYQKILEVQQVFDVSAIDKTIATIRGKTVDQLGLYTEGYRECLYVLVKQMILGGIHKNKILPIVEIWQNHTLIGVQNRWERTPELLKIIEIYGLLQETSLSSALFKEMLQTSMGPGWYKEGQFDLLNTLLSVKNVPANVNDYFARFAGILDFASGEMTFQQYIRNDKGGFIRNVIEQGSLNKGIDYFKFETMPPPDVTIFNAENFTTDMPLPGDGYNLGANNLNQEYSVLQILKAKMHPLLRWAVARTFIVNNDVDRYLHYYSSNLSTAINQLIQSSGVQPAGLLEDAANFAVSEKMKEVSIHFVNEFGGKLTGAYKTEFQGYLLAKGVEWQIEKEQEDDEKAELHKDDSLEDNRFDQFNDAYAEGKIGVEKLVSMGCQAFLDERISIWYNNYSSSSKLAQDNIKALLRSDKDILPYIKEHIRRAESSGWSIVNHLLWYFENILTDQQTIEVYETVVEHFLLIVRPDQKYLDKYQWMNDSLSIASNDEEMGKFLIWLLNHPVTFVRKQAFSCIDIILTQEPSLLAKLLIEEAVSGAPFASPEQAAILLTKLANRNATVIAGIIDDDEALYESVLAVKHFCIRKRFLDISVKFNDHVPHRLYKALKASFPKAVILVGEVALDEPYLHSINFEIEALNRLSILDRQFCVTLLSSIKRFALPLTVKDLIKSDKYLQRSFQDDSAICSRFHELVKHALNIAITPRVDENNLDRVFEILND